MMRWNPISSQMRYEIILRFVINNIVMTSLKNGLQKYELDKNI